MNCNMTPQEYHKLRDEIYDDLVSAGVISSDDEDFVAFDNILGSKLNVKW